VVSIATVRVSAEWVKEINLKTATAQSFCRNGEMPPQGGKGLLERILGLIRLAGVIRPPYP